MSSALAVVVLAMLFFHSPVSATWPVIPSPSAPLIKVVTFIISTLEVIIEPPGTMVVKMGRRKERWWWWRSIVVVWGEIWWMANTAGWEVWGIGSTTIVHRIEIPLRMIMMVLLVTPSSVIVVVLLLLLLLLPIVVVVVATVVVVVFVAHFVVVGVGSVATALLLVGSMV
jgi:hypothetical protein